MISRARAIPGGPARQAARTVICKKGAPQAVDQALMWSEPHARLETVGSLAEGIALCLHEEVDRLVINMFSFTSDELTSLMLFRELRPRQRVVIVCGEEVAPMFSQTGLATECRVMVPSCDSGRAASAHGRR